MSSVTIVALAFFFALCFASCHAFVFDNCGSTLGKFTDISVSGCPTSDEKCILVRGTNASISIKFIPSEYENYVQNCTSNLSVRIRFQINDEDISQVDVRVYGIILDVPVPFPLEKPNACKDPDDGIVCPLHKDQEYHYTTTMFIQKKFPSVKVDIKWELINEKGAKIVCIEFPGKVK